MRRRGSRPSGERPSAAAGIPAPRSLAPAGASAAAEESGPAPLRADEGPALTPTRSLPGGKRQLHLTGFMGSGKSTVGRIVARRLLWNFLDLDGVIERHAGRRIAEIFAADGEPAFRDIERHVLRQVTEKPLAVVALGGGTLLDAANRERCAATAVVVWLRCPLDILRRRLGEISAERPLWGDEERLATLLAEREPGYRSADLTVDASGAPEEVAEVILERLGVT